MPFFEEVNTSRNPQNRIELSQGKVVVDDVGRGMVNGRLAMTRSIGDLELKRFGVSAVPDVRKIKVKKPIIICLRQAFHP